MKVEPGNILKLFLNFSNFEPQYSYRLYSYKKKSAFDKVCTVNACHSRKQEVIQEFLIGRGSGGDLQLSLYFSLFSSMHHKMLEIFPDFAVTGDRLDVLSSISCLSPAELQQQ